jgi:hypothetical protein
VQKHHATDGLRLGPKTFASFCLGSNPARITRLAAGNPTADSNSISDVVVSSSDGSIRTRIMRSISTYLARDTKDSSDDRDPSLSEALLSVNFRSIEDSSKIYLVSCLVQCMVRCLKSE